MYRVGHGYDVHKFATDRKLILGGVEIPHEQGLHGHSDADVAIHALMDALLGALALGDIGEIFPDDDPQYKNISSLKLLAKLLEIEHFEPYEIMNLDITIVAQSPKLRPYIDQMRTNLAEVLDCAPDRVSVKATTTERLGFCGREEGIAAYAVVLVGR
ncbi:2-C-methyl-D-erythritol 2,4-cyclodiphosphate synthase [Lentisphaerota bacterium ZTH]|nr:2-C-methyl-D-erythritol 2,4-cyclodiphosphate synthase [Lentisphaerota bacterium]WET06359.1 2-C-methyl-D-erythritol 2,4-cyclodiphosphate synthase [Lentisphaerota bacterium ZTH]